MKYKPKTKEELKELVDDLSISLDDIDTSLIDDMAGLFYFSDRTDFSGIENWNVSNVQNMHSMFACTNFNQDISKWDVSNVRIMISMFRNSKFNQDISSWNVSNVRNMSCMFENSEFNQDISKWDVSNVLDISNMFYNSPLEGNEHNWYNKINNKII